MERTNDASKKENGARRRRHHWPANRQRLSPELHPRAPTPATTTHHKQRRKEDDTAVTRQRDDVSQDITTTPPGRGTTPASAVVDGPAQHWTELSLEVPGNKTKSARHERQPTAAPTNDAPTGSGTPTTHSDHGQRPREGALTPSPQPREGDPRARRPQHDAGKGRPGGRRRKRREHPRRAAEATAPEWHQRRRGPPKLEADATPDQGRPPQGERRRGATAAEDGEAQQGCTRPCPAAAAASRSAPGSHDTRRGREATSRSGHGGGRSGEGEAGSGPRRPPAARGGAGRRPWFGGRGRRERGREGGGKRSRVRLGHRRRPVRRRRRQRPPEAVRRGREAVARCRPRVAREGRRGGGYAPDVNNVIESCSL